MFKDTQGLVERCIRRDGKAWTEFVERFSGLLYYSARERLQRNGIAFGQQDLEDIVQGVFLEIWERQRLGEVRDRHKITAWLSLVAQTRALNYMWQRKERLLCKDEFYKIDNIKADPASGNRGFLMEELEMAIEEFDVKEKMVLKLNIIYGKKHKEIARFMNIPINTVSTIIARKKKILKERLKEFGIS